MNVYTLEYKQTLPISLEESWEFFATPKNLSQITPKELGLTVTSKIPEKMYPGLIIKYKVSPVSFVKMNWVTEITHIEDLHYFVDEQRFGPYKFWHHKHFFKQTDNGVEITDIVDYALPFSPLMDFMNDLMVKEKLRFIFDYRSKVLEELFPG